MPCWYTVLVYWPAILSAADSTVIAIKHSSPAECQAYSIHPLQRWLTRENQHYMIAKEGEHWYVHMKTLGRFDSSGVILVPNLDMIIPPDLLDDANPVMISQSAEGTQIPHATLDGQHPEVLLHPPGTPRGK